MACLSSFLAFFLSFLFFFDTCLLLKRWDAHEGNPHASAGSVDIVHFALHDSATLADTGLTRSCSRASAVFFQPFLSFVSQLEAAGSE